MTKVNLKYFSVISLMKDNKICNIHIKHNEKYDTKKRYNKLIEHIESIFESKPEYISIFNILTFKNK